MAVKTFACGDRVVVKLPGKRAFAGKVYAQYRDGPRTERYICVETPGGCGVAYRIRYVHHASKAP